ncbi:MFS transporter [Streptomyces sp. 5-10]|uniref:MFS transporter n=1 Tax=Streptomyces sp. 5-10 TaxID=878925 RepID=UPI00168AD143|nr:MFS transporter [Streptomyces sp. 5-10]MBD3006395.1 MFS transporter [Streptomyces sp. 5-10]
MKIFRRPGLRDLLLPASIIVSFLASSSAPTPLYAAYADLWHFSPITTTTVFGVYAITVLAALLVLGRASNHLGRKPVLLGALALQIAAMIVFGEADCTVALFTGRILQGIATGSALGTLGAMMLDIDRESGTRANAVAPGLGSGTGALFSGLIVQYLPAPTRLVYAVFIGIFAVQALGVALLPRGTGRRPGLCAALVLELVMPRHLRRAFLAVAPVLFAVWSLGGFYGSLAPGLARQLSGSNSVVLGALGLFVLTVVSSTTIIVFARMTAKTMMYLGIALLVLGSLGTLVAVEASSATGFFAGASVFGIGFGAGLPITLRGTSATTASGSLPCANIPSTPRTGLTPPRLTQTVHRRCRRCCVGW